MLSGFLLTSDGKRIAYDHYNYGHKNLILIVHGFYNSKDAILLKKLAKGLINKYDIFMFDFRGHGKSGGLFSWTSKENKDLKAALDYIDEKYNKAGMIAFSLGASVAINTLAHDSRIDSLICVSAASDFNKVDYNLWKLDWRGDLLYTLFASEGRKGRGIRTGPFWLKKQKPINNIHKIKIPILYIHGEKDWVVKAWHSQVLYDKTQTKKKLVIVKNGPHAEYLMKDSSEELMSQIKSWLASTL